MPKYTPVIERALWAGTPDLEEFEHGRAAMAAEVCELTKHAGTGALLSAERGKALGYRSGHDEKVADEFRAHLASLRAFLDTTEGLGER